MLKIKSEMPKTLAITSITGLVHDVVGVLVRQGLSSNDIKNLRHSCGFFYRNSSLKALYNKFNIKIIHHHYCTTIFNSPSDGLWGLERVSLKKAIELNEPLTKPRLFETYYANARRVILTANNHCPHSTNFTLYDNDELYASGYNESGQLGLGYMSNVRVNAKVTFFSERNLKIKQIVCWQSLTFFLCHNGEVYFSGDYHCEDAIGAFLLSTEKIRSTPTRIEFFSQNMLRVKKLIRASSACFFQCEHNRLYVRGRNGHGYSRFGCGRFRSQINEPILISYFSLNHIEITHVLAGPNTTFFLGKNGDLYGCGFNNNGILTPEIPRYTHKPTRLNFFADKGLRVVQVNQSDVETAILCHNGEVWLAGMSNFHLINLHKSHFFSPNLETPCVDEKLFVSKLGGICDGLLFLYDRVADLFYYDFHKKYLGRIQFPERSAEKESDQQVETRLKPPSM